MPEKAILDNDVLIKACCYALVDDVLEILGSATALNITRIVVTKQVQRSSRIADKSAAQAELGRLLDELSYIEPSDEEIAFAAELEAQALVRNLPLDFGESQILAVLVSRAATLMLTGDKRAIGAIEAVLTAVGREGQCNGRVACLEQLIMAVLERRTAASLQHSICREPGVDKALSTVFSCTAGTPVQEKSARDGLLSYIRHVRNSAPEALVAEDVLSVTLRQSSRRNTA